MIFALAKCKAPPMVPRALSRPPAEQAPGPQDQHHRHDDELGDQGELRVAQADAERLDLADQQRGEECAGNRAQAADHHDHEGVRDDRQVDLEVRRLARDGERAAEAGERRAEREHAGEQPALVHAERAGHLAVLGRGAHQDAPARPRQQQVQRDEDHRPERDQEQVVLRETPAGDVDRAGQAGRARPEQVLRSPGPEREILDDQHQREGGEELQQLRRAVDPPQEKNLDQQRRTRRPPAAASGTLSQKPTRPESQTARYMPSMYSEPCAKLTMRLTPKISDSPAATRNSELAPASPFRNCSRTAARSILPFHSFRSARIS